MLVSSAHNIILGGDFYLHLFHVSRRERPGVLRISRAESEELDKDVVLSGGSCGVEYVVRELPRVCHDQPGRKLHLLKGATVVQSRSPASSRPWHRTDAFALRSRRQECNRYGGAATIFWPESANPPTLAGPVQCIIARRRERHVAGLKPGSCPKCPSLPSRPAPPRRPRPAPRPADGGRPPRTRSAPPSPRSRRPTPPPRAAPIGPAAGRRAPPRRLRSIAAIPASSPKVRCAAPAWRR